MNTTADKAIRIGAACVATVALSFLWQAMMPPTISAAVSFAVGCALGWWAVSNHAPHAPQVIPTYRVEVRPDDYVADKGGLRERMTAPGWSAPDVEHLHGIPWHEAPIPPKRHECWPQTNGWIGFDQTQRCACGAIRGIRFGGTWFERNSRKATVDGRRQS